MRRSWQRSAPQPPVAPIKSLPATDAAPTQVAARRRDALRRWVGLETSPHPRGCNERDVAGDLAAPHRPEPPTSRSMPLSLSRHLDGFSSANTIQCDANFPPDRPGRKAQSTPPPVPLNPVTWCLWIATSLLAVSFWLIRFLLRSACSLRRDQLRSAQLKLRLEQATRYSDWYSIALALDDLEYNTDWKTASSLKSDRRFCDVPLLRARIREMRKLHVAGDTRGLVFTLQAGLLRHFAGLDNPELHAHSLVGTKLDVEDYVHVVSYFLEEIAKSSLELSRPPDDGQYSTALRGQEKLSFFNEARHAYGRTALVLSGGYIMGVDHLGAMRVLLNQGLLPRVVAGVASGAVSASLLGVFTNDELQEKMKGLDDPQTGFGAGWDFEHCNVASPWSKLVRLLTTGAVNDINVLQTCVRRNLGDTTFEEAYLRTKRILNIIIAPAHPTKNEEDAPIVLNYLTAPHVAIWSAVAASAALPVLFSPVELVAKNVTGNLVPFHLDGIKWVDGSMRGNLPLSRISELFNVNHFIVSRTSISNFSQRRFLVRSTLAQLLGAELRFRYSQLQGWNLTPRFLASIFPNADPNLHSRITVPCLIGFGDIPLMFRSPRPAEILAVVQRGEQATFPVIDRVYHRCLLELSLEWWVEHVAHETQRTPTATSRRLLNRVPSWLWHDSGTTSPGLISGDFGRARRSSSIKSLEFVLEDALSVADTPQEESRISAEDAEDDDEFEERIMC